MQHNVITQEYSILPDLSHRMRLRKKGLCLAEEERGSREGDLEAKTWKLVFWQHQWGQLKKLASREGVT